MKLTVVIPTLNEEKDLPTTLSSIKNLADEIVIIDSGSTDNTTKIARNAGAQVIPRPFISFSDTRNFGDKNSKGDWILSIEADVFVTKELAKEIELASDDDNYSAYHIGRENIIWGAPVLHADWGPKDDRHIWLYQKGAGEWQGQVHEEYISTGNVGFLKNHLIHRNYETVSEYINKIDRYSELALKQKQSFPSWWFIRDFLKRYFYKLGFLDGYRGIFLCYLQSIYYLTFTVKKETQE